MNDRNELDEAARHCHDMLHYLQEHYTRAAKPFIDRLLMIENARPRSYVVDGKTFVPIDAALAGHALDGMNGKHAVCGISALLKDADTLIEEWTGILQANDLRNSAIDGDAWRVRFAALAGNEGKGK